MKFIKQNSIDIVIDEARIYDVVNASEKLTKKGIHWFCKSPFNSSDDTPSCCVNVLKNTFFDYSAGFGGNPITFLMKKNSIGFIDAVVKAAEICGIVLEYEGMSEDGKKLQEESLKLKSVLEYTNEQYQKAFNQVPDDHWSKDMLFKKRAFTKDILAVFGVGFAPNIKSFISTPLINRACFEESKTLGLTNTKEGASYDFFRNRIMFPIHNERGEVVGFGGRRSDEESDKDYAKYLNSKESKIYNKEKVLYGIFQAKKSIIEHKKAILLEGYTDVIALHQAGVTNSIATCGTSLTENHAKIIAKLCKQVVLFRDGDKAGINATHRDIDVLVKEGVTVFVVVCPEGEDPDSLSRKCDINDFIKKHAEDAIIWKAGELIKTAVHPDLESLTNTIRSQYEKDIEAIRMDMAPESAFEGLSALDKKFLKEDNQKKFSKIRELEQELKASIDDLPKYEPYLFSEAIEKIGLTLHRIKNTIAQKEYIKMVSKTAGVKIQVIQQIVNEIESREEKERQKKTKQSQSDENEKLRLPKGADKEQFLNDRFCEIGNSYWFQTDSEVFIKGTNFKLTPLFHVEGKSDNKRLCEVINEEGHKRLIDFDSKDFVNWQRIQERLIDEGNFYWEPGVTVKHFKLVTKKLLAGFHTAQELKTLGLQREGFFAFADGVFHQNSFHEVNKYGIVYLEGLERDKSEYRSDINHFYSPSHSEIYKFMREDDDPYENDRHFVYKKAQVSIDLWMKQVVEVFGNNGKFAVAFCLAANFRDLFLLNYKYFPLLGGFGQKDSGKSGLGVVIQSFFFYDLLPLQMNNASIPGMSRRLTRCKNVVSFFDEYRDDIETEKRELLKGTWNGLGREKGKGAEGSRTTTDKINAALYYAGQYIPTGDDGALTSRTIVLHFQNQEYTITAKENYQKLLNWCQNGITSYVLDVLVHRDKMKAGIERAFSESAKDLKKSLEGRDFQNRVFENYLCLLSVVKMLQDKFSLPFTYDEFLKLCRDGIVENSELIHDSDGLAKFWNIVEFLSRPQDMNQPGRTILKEEHDYQIEKVASFTVTVKRDEKVEWKNKDGIRVLFLNFKSVHQYYHKEVTSRKGEEVISETTLRNYLKSKKYFIGLFSSRRMGDRTPSGYAFNYDMMNRLGILNLGSHKDTQTELPLNINPDEQTIFDLPATEDY